MQRNVARFWRGRTEASLPVATPIVFPFLLYEKAFKPDHGSCSKRTENAVKVILRCPGESCLQHEGKVFFAKTHYRVQTNVTELLKGYQRKMGELGKTFLLKPKMKFTP